MWLLPGWPVVRRETLTRIRDKFTSQGIDPAIAESLAVTILSAVEGAVVIAQAQRSTRPVEEVGARLAELVALHLPAGPDPSAP
ncbi:hypothetical protein ACLQ3C_13865 [Gordonia sp. DT30]|uniref:LmrA/YxaF family transcription factor n=1 Tax=Gordonia sp. DT30 TaxID=3416546 RepID=UPI003CED6B19